MEEVGQGHFGCFAPVCSVPVPGTEPSALSVLYVAVAVAFAAAGLADLLLQLPELADWLERRHGQHELHGLHWTAARQQPGAVPEPAAATAVAALAIKLSAAENQRQVKERERARIYDKEGKSSV